MKDKFIVKKKFMTFLLVYFVLFTSYFSIITLSKYVGVTNRSGTVAIAKWDVSLDTSDNNSNIVSVTIGNTNPTYVLKITSLSETKALYSIVLSDLPEDLEVKLNDKIIQKSFLIGNINRLKLKMKSITDQEKEKSSRYEKRLLASKIISYNKSRIIKNRQAKNIFNKK